MQNRGNYYLSMQDYCKGCPEFEVGVLKDEVFEVDCCVINMVRRYRDRTIGCIHHERCAIMIDYLKRVEEINEND